MSVPDHEHRFTILLSIPVRMMGAVTGYADYRECSVCGRRVPASSLTPEGRETEPDTWSPND